MADRSRERRHPRDRDRHEERCWLVTGTIRSLASDVEGAFHKAFSWLSPTKMTIDLGRDMMLGLAQGILAYQGVAHDAIRPSRPG